MAKRKGYYKIAGRKGKKLSDIQHNSMILPKWMRDESKRWRKETVPGMVTEMNDVAREQGGDPLAARKTIWDMWTVLGYGFWSKFWMALKIRFGMEVTLSVKGIGTKFPREAPGVIVDSQGNK